MYNVDVNSILRNISIINAIDSFNDYVKPSEHVHFSVVKDIFVNHVNTLSNKHLHLNQKYTNASFSCQRLQKTFDPTTLWYNI